MLVYWIAIVVMWVICHLLFRIETVGLENFKAARDGRPLILAPNHISAMDPVFIVITARPWDRMVTVAKQELFKDPFLAWLFTCFGAVAIDRGKGDTSLLDEVTAQCRAGKTLFIFPEGTRSKTGQLGMLKSGAFLIASQAGAAMVPCRVIYGTPDGRLRLFCRVRICFGPAIPAGTFVIEDPTHRVAALRRMKNALKDALEALLEENRFA